MIRMGMGLKDCKRDQMGFRSSGNQQKFFKKYTFKWNRLPLLSCLFTSSYFLFLFKNHLERIMQQNKEQRGGELFIGGRKFKLCWHCVTELNSYQRLFPQL